MLQETYIYLNQINLVHSQYEFSREWLGKTKTYCSSLKSTGRSPSIKVLFTLKLRLEGLLARMDAKPEKMRLLGKQFNHCSDIKAIIKSIDAQIKQICSPAINVK